jgi:hypothetical protein
LPEPTYRRSDFEAPEAECDVVMKGGVTSGMVYPYAVLELARRRRFRSLGGASAGGIAAAMAAAAEYARRNGDPDGFVRLEERCLELPGVLSRLFQPAPALRGLMRILRAAQGGKPLPVVGAALLALWRPALAGAVAGALLLLAVGGGWLSAGMAALAAGAAAVLYRLYQGVTRALPAHGFGLCSGLAVGPGQGPGLTDWIHESLQYVAFGPAGADRAPLTFGDLRQGGPSIDLRMVTTNLSMRRPHALPALTRGMMFSEGAWRRLFPAAVMAFLTRPEVSPRSKYGDLRFTPEADRLPVVVAVRMSLSFPVLISAVPLAIRDLEAERRTAARGEPHHPRVAALWFSDGGLSSNFPIHFFDAVLPTRPTFALSLDPLPPDVPTSAARVTLPKDARSGVFLPITPIVSFGGFISSLLGAAKDWQDNVQSVMPGHRERIVRVALSPAEGGLNLDMAPNVCAQLMEYGREAGVQLRSDFDFDEHRWRRALIAYEQLEGLVDTTAQVWNGGYGAWFAAYKSAPRSYTRSLPWERARFEAGLDAVAGLAPQFQPPLRGKPDRFPRPKARLRITPDV